VSNQSIIILGAGLTGLSYGYGKIRRGHKVTIFERDNMVGGLMRTYNFNGFLFDFGPHIFRSKDEKVSKFVKYILRGNYHAVSSNPAIFKYGTIFDNVIPVITIRNVYNLPRILQEKTKMEIQQLKNNRKPDTSNFKNCIVSQIGETLYWEFFGEYSKKWWGIDPEKLSSDLAPKNLRIDKRKTYGHITTDFTKINNEIYPVKGGVFEIVRGLVNEINKLGGIIKTECNVRGLCVDGDSISHIIVECGNDELEISTDDKQIVSTIPMNKICEMLNIKFDLQYRGDICIFLKFRGNRTLDYSWMYFHDSDIIFSRIYEPLYYSVYNVPKGYSSFCVEVTCFDGDNVWRNKHLGDKVIEQLIDLSIIKRSQEPEIIGIAKDPHAYPVFTVDYKQKLYGVPSIHNPVSIQITPYSKQIANSSSIPMGQNQTT